MSDQTAQTVSPAEAAPPRPPAHLRVLAGVQVAEALAVVLADLSPHIKVCKCV